MGTQDRHSFQKYWVNMLPRETRKGGRTEMGYGGRYWGQLQAFTADPSSISPVFIPLAGEGSQGTAILRAVLELLWHRGRPGRRSIWRDQSPDGLKHKSSQKQNSALMFLMLRFIYFYCMCMRDLPPCVCTTCAWCHWQSEEGAVAPRNGATNGYELDFCCAAQSYRTNSRTSSFLPKETCLTNGQDLNYLHVLLNNNLPKTFKALFTCC